MGATDETPRPRRPGRPRGHHRPPRRPPKAGVRVNAGWFPDPTGQPGQRYYDGQRWTQHFVPTRYTGQRRLMTYQKITVKGRVSAAIAALVAIAALPVS